MPPIISGRRAFSIQTFISSTALSPASIETPAASYVDMRSLRSVESVSSAAAGQRSRQPVDVESTVGYHSGRFEQVLAEQLGLGQRHRVDAVEAGPAQVVRGNRGRLDQLLQGDVGERVGVDRRADLVD